MVTEQQTKKRKVSKKRKRAWRKHIDTRDIDAFLENVNLEERLGVPVSDRPDAELFTVDTNRETVKSTVTKKERRLMLKNKEPKFLSFLKPHTLVPDPISKRNTVKLKSASRINKKRKIDIGAKEKLVSKNEDCTEETTNSTKEERDIWDEKTVSQTGASTEWLSSDTVRHTLTHLGIRKRKLPSSLRKKPSSLPSIELPHPGTSYNPSYNDHQKLLKEIVDDELDQMKKEAHLERVTTKMFKKVTREEKQKSAMEEMLEGLPLKNSQKDTDDEDDKDPLVKSVNPPVVNMKKTRQERRKLKEQKDLARKRAQEKLEKKKISDLYRVKLLQKQLDAKEGKLQLMRERRLKQKALKSLAPKMLSRVKFEPMEPNFKLSNELTGNLRSCAPTGNLLKDRYKSLQQRNIVAPSTLVLKRTKANVKRYIKPDHKIHYESK